jgi:cytochrome c553
MLSFSMGALGASAVALGAGSADEGQSKSTACTACHGPNGNSANPEWPNLAGQHEQYIRKQLQAFKSGARKNPLMTPMAMSLSDDDMDDLGAFFSSQKPAGLEADPGKLALGQRIFRSGDPKSGVPACASCHGPAAALSVWNVCGRATACVPRRHSPDGSEQDDARRRGHDVRRPDRCRRFVCSGPALKLELS